MPLCVFITPKYIYRLNLSGRCSSRNGFFCTILTQKCGHTFCSIEIPFSAKLLNRKGSHRTHSGENKRAIPFYQCERADTPANDVMQNQGPSKLSCRKTNLLLSLFQEHFDQCSEKEKHLCVKSRIPFNKVTRFNCSARKVWNGKQCEGMGCPINIGSITVQ